MRVKEKGDEWLIIFCTSILFYMFVSQWCQGINKKSIDTNVSMNWLVLGIKTNLGASFTFKMSYRHGLSQLCGAKIMSQLLKASFASYASMLKFNQWFHITMITIKAF